MKTITPTSLRPSLRHVQRLLLVVVATAAALALVLAAPASATEAGGEGEPATAEVDETGGAAEGHGGEGDGKLTISDNPHDQFGLVLFGLGGIALAFALYNAANQLAGKRPAADGRIRWR